MSTLAPEKRATIIRLRREGKSLDACRAATGASWETVSTVLYEAGLRAEPPKLKRDRRLESRRRTKAPRQPGRPPVPVPASRPAAGELTAPPGTRDPFAGRGCPTGTCRNLVGCSCGAPKVSRRLSRAEVAVTPVRTDFRIAEASARGRTSVVDVALPKRRERQLLPAIAIE